MDVMETSSIKDYKRDAKDIKKCDQNVFRSKSFNWQISYNLINSSPHNLILQHASSCLSHSCRKELGNVCPADFKMLRLQPYGFIKDTNLKPKYKDLGTSEASFQEYESILDLQQSDSIIEPKIRTWDEYKRLIKLSKSTPKPQLNLKPLLTHVTSWQKICIRRKVKKLRLTTGIQSKKSIIKTEVQRTILIANSTYVQFRNFKSHTLYKKVITLKNISISPARYRIERRPSCSKFLVMLKCIKGERNIISPGMQVRLIIYFRCDILDEPEEVLIIRVKSGKPIFIKLHAYKDPPILTGINTIKEERRSILGEKITSSIHTWHPSDTTIVDDNEEIIVENNSGKMSSMNFYDRRLTNAIFDCKKCFVGEQILTCIKFRNCGGNGRFFVMSEIDWYSMHLEDITNRNMLILPCFAVRPVYFSLMSQEEICLQTYFFPNSYGMHVDKLYIVCDNCSVIAMEIIGDGIVYETSFIQLSKQLEKISPSKISVDERARYYINLGTSFPNGIAQGVISVTNTSGMDMHFRWEKRNVLTVEEIEGKHFPLQFLDVYPNQEVLSSSSIHHFTVSAELKNLQPNHYVTILQLYVEDIPLASVPKEADINVDVCRNRKRTCLKPIDIWIADIEVWVQCVLPDGSENDILREMSKSIIEVSPESDFSIEEYSEADKIEGDEQATEEYNSMLHLTMEELFSYYDFVNLKQIEDLFRDHIISIGVMRPTRTLYVNTEETYSLMIKNLSYYSVIYTWGEAIGTDNSKLKVCICPNKGEIPGGRAEKVKISFLPVKQGIIRFLHIPCYIEDSKKILMLRIECTIKPFYITFYVPATNNELLEVNNFIPIEWHADSLKVALDLAGKHHGNLAVLNKYRMQEERELMNMDLDQGDIVRDASTGTSFCDLHEAKLEVHSSSACTSEIIQYYNSEVENEIVPYYKTVLPSLTQPIVIEFLKIPLRTVKKKSFIIKNETPISSSFCLSIKNFYPVHCSCKRKSKKDYIKSIYRKVFGCDEGLVEETLNGLKQPESGIVIYVYPLKADIGPFQAVPVDIYVFADTWGVYIDELQINVFGLPQYELGICVEVIGSPILLPMNMGTLPKMPTLRFGVTRVGTRPDSRKILIRNTSIIPVALTWHTFLIKPMVTTQLLPFNIVLDTFTPLTDDLARTLSMRKRESDIDKLLQAKLERYRSTNSSESLDKFDPMSVTNSDNVGSSIFTDPMTDSSIHSSYSSSMILTSANEEATIMESSNYVNSRLGKLYPKIDDGVSEVTKETEFNVSIIPYYGVADTKACTVSPREIIVSPKGNAYVTITIHPEKCNTEIEDKFLCKVIGFLRIAPADKYRDNRYSRQDSNFFPPVEIDVTADIVKPRLAFDMSKSDRTFKVCANDVMQNPKKLLQQYKTFFFHNPEDDTICVHFETHDPFSIKSVSIYDKVNPYEPLERICINGHGCAEVEITCIVDRDLIEAMIQTSKSQDLHNSTMTLKAPLVITHSDRTNQEVQLILQICLPSLNLSSYTLNFGFVYVGDTKKLVLLIENISACEQSFTIHKKFNNNNYSIDKKNGKLLARPLSGSCCPITISFEPKLPQHMGETLEITTSTPNGMEECILYGEGTFNEKYHAPGL